MGVTYNKSQQVVSDAVKLIFTVNIVSFWRDADNEKTETPRVSRFFIDSAFHFFFAFNSLALSFVIIYLQTILQNPFHLTTYASAWVSNPNPRQFR